MNTPKHIVVIPTYNEVENVEAIIRAVMALSEPFHILIVDDNSPDGTAIVVENLQKIFEERLFLIVRKKKLGLGSAYVHGFRWAITQKYAYIYEMDADFSHNPQDLEKLYTACAKEGNDLAIGSRYFNGVNVVNWPMSRVLMSYFASWYVRIITRIPVQDTTAGFKCYRREVLETIDLNKIHFLGYAFQIEMKFLTWKYGFRIKEVPIIFVDRRKGVSKMSKKIFREAVLGVLWMSICSLFTSYKHPTTAAKP